MLKRKMFRDIKNNITQFLAIFFMVFLGVFVFTGIHSYMDGMKKSADIYYEKNNLQDIWVSGKNFTLDDLNNIKKIENVRDAERMLTIKTNLEGYKDITLETNFIESNNISKMHVVEGEPFSKDKKGIWIDSYIANYLKIKTGDKIKLKYQDYTIEEVVLGLVNTPDHVYFVKDSSEIFPTHKDYGYVYLSIDEFPQDYIYDEIKDKYKITDTSLIKKIIPNFNIEDYYIFNGIIVDVDNESKIDNTVSNIENKIEKAIAVTKRDSNPSYETYNAEIEEGDTYSGIFTFLFLFIAILSVVTTMNRFIKKERTQIGTLKSLGFREKKINKLYVGYGFYIALLASILGLVLGSLVMGNMFLNLETEYFEMPNCHIYLKPIVFILAIIVVLLITLISYLSCKKILKEEASSLLRIEAPNITPTKFDLTNKKVFKKASISTKWNIRDIYRNSGRTIMAIIGIIGSCMLLVCAFGMLDTMNSYMSWEFDKINKFNYKLTLNQDYTEEELNSLIETYGESTSQTLGIEVKDKAGKKQTNSLIVNNAEEHLKYTDHDAKYINISSDGIYITEKLSEVINLKVGDNITWHIFGNDTWYTTKIIGLNRDPQNQNLNMTKECFEKLGLNYKADTIYTDKDLSKVKQLSGVETIQNKKALRASMENMLETTKTIVVILILVSSVLGFIIIYNLGILSFSEKQYQFATLKVLGFKDKQIKKIFVKQNIWITILAIIIGLPLGYITLHYIFENALGDTYDFDAKITILSYFYSCFGTFVVSYIVNKVLSKKINSIDMVSSLKSNE